MLTKGKEYVRSRYLDTIKLTDKLPTDSKLEGRMREMFMLNFYWFMQCLLDRKDRMSMYTGLEVRVPFCDYRIVEYAYNMPWSLKAYKGREKALYERPLKAIYPKKLFTERKAPTQNSQSLLF